ncbi:FAD-binding domain-containing protein [Lindgomyces ingoldianus]|uniref:FAD-binding domain-containing protein n=1 Tax=Lindgomyces ingoldianus TaxID=673940 RepID=A0ACB6R388_9PLEO|nr:FAD-binding domain-containing protein [Lindgomyces ingoldianus]KAF2472977.1 FAD-binding domain-containing protein [Lindgomyces ingoldianus]
MFLPPLLFLSLLTSSAPVFALNFDWEKIQLTEAETRNYSAIQFAGPLSNAPKKNCRSIPGDADWPTEAQWAKFNKTLGGALLKPRPLAAACYSGPQYDANRCQELKQMWSNTFLHMSDPTSIMSQWSSGNTCVPTSNPNSTCSQGGYPVYVVNATTVRHVQLAVNFARNSNIRLVVKNSGHDFNGKSIGGNALSVWTHNLKALTYHTNYSAPEYTGRAVAYGAGIQAFDAYKAMSTYNMTMIVAGGSTVGLAGGFVQGGGHSTYTSFYGLAADQVLRIQAVTASGKFVNADAEENEDLYWAFRGGGGGTYGIITSIVVKAFPVTPVASGSIAFSTVANPAIKNSTAVPVETFWKGVKEYWAYCIALCDAGGLGYNFIRHTHSANTTGLTFTTSISLPNHTIPQYRQFIRPLIQKLNTIGIPLPLPPIQRFNNYYTRDIPNAVSGDTVGNTRFASRFFLRSNYDTHSALEEMHAAIRDFVEGGGYTLHGINYSPTLEVAGNPDNAVHPAFRETIMHAEGFDSSAWWDGKTPIASISSQKSQHDRLQSYMQKWRDITPGSGSYINEGDAQEPEWKDAFFGSNYERLAAVKRRWDRWGLFYTVSGVGSDEWEVKGSSGGGREGVLTQDGRLCRVGV